MKRVPKIVWSLLACVICIVVTAAACLILADSGASSDKYMEVIRVIKTTFYQPKDTSSLGGRLRERHGGLAGRPGKLLSACFRV